MNSEATRVRGWLAVLAGGLALSLAACADFSRGPSSAAGHDAGVDAGAGDAAAAEGGGGTSFAEDIEPLLVPTCQTCHAAGGQAADTRLLFTGKPATDYTAVVSFVDTSSPSGSRLLSKMSGNGHQGGAVYAAGS